MRVLCVMDPLKKLNPVWDNSLYILSRLQDRGHDCWIADCKDLIPKKNSLTIRASKLWATPRNRKGPIKRKFSIQTRKKFQITQFDLVLIRKEPPVDEAFLTMTHRLEAFAHQIPMVNHPRGIRETNEKLSTLHFPRYAPLSIVSSSANDILEFRERAGGDIVVKPLNLKAGRGVFRLKNASSKSVSKLRRATRNGQETLIAQRFVKAKHPVEKRIVLLKGKVLAAYEKKPKPGEFRGNLDLGASFHPTVLTSVEKQIVRAIKPLLLKRGLSFVGIDVLNGKLLEINVTCPAGVTEFKFLRPDLRPEQAWVEFLEGLARQRRN